MKSRKAAMPVILCLLSVCWCFGQEVETAPADSQDQAEQTKTLREVFSAVSPSIVHVQYHLKYDKGEAPSRMSNIIEQERPLKTAGFLIAPDIVVTGDQKIHPRFIKSITVACGEQEVSSTPMAWGQTQTALLVKLSSPLTSATPLVFAPDAEGPYYTVRHARDNGLWSTWIAKHSRSLGVRADGFEGQSIGWYSVIADKKGRCVGICMNGNIPADESWKGNPLESWKLVTSAALDSDLDKLEKVVKAGILTASLSLRSPKKKGGMYSSYSATDDEDEETEKYVPAILVSPTRAVVLANLKPKVTARLEKISLAAKVGDEERSTEGKFVGTLTDYGAFIVELDKHIGQPLQMAKAGITDYRHIMLMSADVRVRGRTRTDYYMHDRIYQYSLGWREHLYPGIRGDDHETFLFDEDHKLVALPVARREKGGQDRRRWEREEILLTSSCDFAQVFGDLPANLDPSNVPLTEADESRLAWLGVELQPLDKELARANKVSKLSRDGKIGGLVSYVYPDSPAAKAGIEPGYILLRLHVEEYPKPVEIEVESYLGGRSFPWQQYDQLPEQYYEHVPTPWSPAENKLTRALTDIGFGKSFQAEFFSDGQVSRKSFTVGQSPPHYDTAEKYKSDTLGLTVRDLTYEVRRYFQKADDEPGVIASKIEPGGKASVSGVKPYEIITEVNGTSVMNVKDFARLIEGQSRLRLAVKRMAEGRVATIRLKDATTKPADDEPGEDPSASD